MRKASLSVLLFLLATISARGLGIGDQLIWTSTGPPGTVLFVAVDPSDSSVVYSATASRAFKSTTGGRGWEEIARAPEDSRITALIVSPTSPSTLYAATATVDNESLAPPSTVYRSPDRGTTWILVETFPLDLITTLAGGYQNAETLYAGGWSRVCSPAPCVRGSLYSSADQGDSWREIDSGLAGSFPISALVVDPTRPSLLYAGTPVGIFKSSDGGASWQASSSGLEKCSTAVTALAIDPRAPFVLFAGVYHAAFNDVGCMTVFKSVDGGATWEFTGAPRIHVSSLVVDPTNSNVVYASAQYGVRFFSPPPGVFRSGDGGITWKQLAAGLPAFLSVRALAIDSSGMLVHAATDSGVFEYSFGFRQRLPRSVPFRH